MLNMLFSFFLHDGSIIIGKIFSPIQTQNFRLLLDRWHLIPLQWTQYHYWYCHAWAILQILHHGTIIIGKKMCINHDFCFQYCNHGSINILHQNGCHASIIITQLFSPIQNQNFRWLLDGRHIIPQCLQWIIHSWLGRG